LNNNSNINIEKQGCKIGRSEGEWKRLRGGYVVDGLHIPI
jgi:hypothetical protein